MFPSRLWEGSGEGMFPPPSAVWVDGPSPDPSRKREGRRVYRYLARL